MSHTSRTRKLVVVLLALVVAASLFPGVASAQSGVGGTTVVESGETVSSVSGVYGTIVIEGTVTGDVSGLAGDVVVRESGIVEGNLDVAAGNVRIAGTVAGSVSAGAGSIHITETGVVQGTFEVGAGEVRIDGRIDGDATIGAETIRLGDNAALAGSLTYDGTLEGNTNAVAGDITRDRSIGTGMVTDIQPFASWVFAINAFLLNLLLGAVLLGLFPRFSNGVAERVTANPVRSGLVGLGTVVAVPIVLVLVAITVIGIPLSLVGLFAFLFVIWIGLVYGRFAVGYWLLTQVDIHNKWAGLVAGLLLAVLLHQIPYVGGLANFVIVMLGIGALIGAIVASRRAKSAGGKSAKTDETHA